MSHMLVASPFNHTLYSRPTSSETLDRQVSTLSGGQKTKLALIRLLFQASDLLLERTNYLICQLASRNEPADKFKAALFRSYLLSLLFGVISAKCTQSICFFCR